MSRRILPLTTLLILFSLLPPLLRAQTDDNQVALVIEHGDGSVLTQCVSFPEDELTGYEVIERSGVPFDAFFFGSLGAAMCSINNEGCPATQNQCLTCGVSSYWVYWRWVDGAWRPSPSGSGVSVVKDGDIEGWRWGDSAPGSEPPVYTFEAICDGAVSAEPTHTPTPTATNTPTPRPPTSTPMPLTLASPTATATATPTTEPTAQPTNTPSPTATATVLATVTPTPPATANPTATADPTTVPTATSTTTATSQPDPTATKMATATVAPTEQPTEAATSAPIVTNSGAVATAEPTTLPTAVPTNTAIPPATSSPEPTAVVVSPTQTVETTSEPTSEPTIVPTDTPVAEPTLTPEAFVVAAIVEPTQVAPTRVAASVIGADLPLPTAHPPEPAVETARSPIDWDGVEQSWVAYGALGFMVVGLSGAIWTTSQRRRLT